MNVANNFRWHGAEPRRRAIEPYISNRQNIQSHFAIYA